MPGSGIQNWLLLDMPRSNRRLLQTTPMPYSAYPTYRVSSFVPKELKSDKACLLSIQVVGWWWALFCFDARCIERQST